MRRITIINKGEWHTYDVAATLRDTIARLKLRGWGCRYTDCKANEGDVETHSLLTIRSWPLVDLSQ